MIASRTARIVIGHELTDLVRSRWLIAYVLFFAIATDALFRFSGADPRALLSLMNVVLLVVPLVAVAFGAMHYYSRREFIELLLAQPVERRQLFTGLYLGLALPLAGGVVLGLALPAAAHGAWNAGLRGTLGTLVGVGVALTLIFTAVALYLAVRLDDRVRGLATAIAVWLGFALLYDGLVLLVVSIFADSALERPLLALIVANPIDLARVLLLLQVDISALMGYTGAVFARVFGGAPGFLVAAAALAAWVAVPAWLGARAFTRKDF
jgi:Cu-processing system permease protein